MKNAKQLSLERQYSKEETFAKSCIEMVHSEISAKNKVYFSIMQLEKGAVKNRFFRNVDNFEKFMISENLIGNKNVDTYYSINEFNCPKRKSEYVFSFQAFYYDLDLHKEEDLGKINHIVDIFMDYIIFSIKKEDMLMPNLIVSTGRGMHLYYVLDKSLPRKGLEWIYSKISENMAEKIREILICLEEDTGANIVLDNCYRDISRVLRLPYTYNTKSKSYSEILYMNKEMKYSIEKLREFNEIPPKPEIKIDKKDRLKKISYVNKGLQLHSDRLGDLLKLLEMRNYDVVGNREMFLFLIRYYNNFVDIKSSEKLISEINNKFTKPLSERELLNTRTANKAYYDWKIDKKNGYNYKNKTLIKIFEITEEEQKELKTIISYEEKKIRRVERNWDNLLRDKDREEKRLEIDNKIGEMLKDGKDYRDIMNELKVSDRRIKSIKQQIIKNKLL